MRKSENFSLGGPCNLPLKDALKAFLILLIVLAVAYGILLALGYTLSSSSEIAGVGLPSDWHDYPHRGIDGWTQIDLAAAGYQDEPFDFLVGKEYLSGRFPLWNPYQAMGTPLAANMVSRAFSPLQIIQDISPHWTWDLFYLLRPLIAAIFTFLFLTELGLPLYCSLLGAISFMLCGNFVWYLRLEEVPSVSMFIPALFWSTERLIKRPTYRNMVLITTFVALSILGGQPQLVFLSFAFVTLFCLFRVYSVAGDRARKISIFITAMCIGFLLSLPQLALFFEYLRNGTHGHGTAMGLNHLSFPFSINLFLPYFWGKIFDFWAEPNLGIQWGNMSSYIGAVNAILVAVSLFTLNRHKDRGIILFFFCVFVFCILKSYGFPLVHWLGNLPIINRVNFPRYSGAVWSFFVAVLAAYGLAGIGSLNKRRLLSIGAITLFIPLLMIILSLLPYVPKGRDSITFNIIALIYSGLGIISFLSVWIVVMVVLFISLRRDDRSNLKKAVILILATELIYYIPYGFDLSFKALKFLFLVFGLAGALCFVLEKKRLALCSLVIAPIVLGGLIILSPKGFPKRYDRFEPLPYMKFLKQDETIFRVFSLEGLLHPDYASAMQIQDIRHLDALYIRQYGNFVRKYLDRESHPAFFAGGVRISPHPFWDTLGALREMHTNRKYYDYVGVKYLLAKQVNPSFDIRHKNHFPADPIPLLQNKMGASFICQTERLDGISLFVGTYARVNRGKLFFRVKRSVDADKALRTVSVEAENLVNNSDVCFFFEPIRNCKGKKLYFELEFPEATPSNNIALYLSKNKIHNVTTFVNGERSSGALRFAECTRLDYAAPLSLVYDDNRVKIYRNDNVFPRAFLVFQTRVARDNDVAMKMIGETEFDFKKEAIVEGEIPENFLSLSHVKDDVPFFKPVEIINYETNTVSLRVNAEKEALLVLNDAYYPGWNAFVDGKKVHVYRVNGLFRGVFLRRGDHVVTFAYQPLSFRLGLLGTFIGLLFIIGGFLMRRAKFWPHVLHDRVEHGDKK